MNNNNQQTNTQVNTSNSTVQPKMLSNAGRSTFFVGVFLVVIISIILPTTISGDTEVEAYDLAYFIVTLLISASWVVVGRSVKNIQNTSGFTGKLNYLIASSLGLAALTILGMALTPRSGGGAAGGLGLILGVYLLVVKSKLANGAKKVT